MVQYLKSLRIQLINDSKKDNEEFDPPIFLLSFVLYLFCFFYNQAVHASGRFVSQLITFLISNNSKNGKNFQLLKCLHIKI